MDFLRRRKIAAAKKKEAAERRKCQLDKERFMLKNGRYMMEELISSFNGKSNPIRSFSAPVILKATNNFDSQLICSWDSYHCYKGIIEGLPVLVKRSWCRTFLDGEMKRIIRDIAVSSHMSSHKNVLKLLGCCLEFPYPVLVFEYAEKGSLNNYHGGLVTGETLPWNIRLKIARETATAISYLHTALPKRMVHGDITPSIVFIDEKWTAKISNFSESMSIPDGETHVEIEGCGTVGFIDPDYWNSGCFSESSDVFSFGILLLVLITGKPPSLIYEIRPDGDDIFKDLVGSARQNDQLTEIMDPGLVEDAVAEEALELQPIQWEAYIELALKCTRDKKEDRPQMIEVAKELMSIEQLTKLSDMNLDKQSDHVEPPAESSGNIQRERADDRVARCVHRQYGFPYFLREYQSLFCLMLIFYLLLQWNT